MITNAIFDMDGTLIDTEKYYRIFWPKAFEKFGCHMTDEQALSMRSLGNPYSMIHLKEMFGEGIDFMAVRQYRREIMEECLDREGIELMPGAIELLKFLKEKGIRTAIATATDMKRAEKYLEKLGLLPYFDRIVSAVMVEKGKPADIYLYTCEQLGAAPEECIAVEDSPNGVLSAYRAGCKVVMVPDQTEPTPDLEKLLYAKADNLLEIRGLFQ